MDIEQKINDIAISEGDGFVYDLPGIENEYSKLDSNKSNLAIKILSILGGFFSTLAFLGFLLIAGLYDSEEGMLATGAIFIGIAIWLNVKFDKLIIDTLSVTAYVLGTCLISFGLAQLDFNENMISISLILLSFIVIMLTRNFILSFISILAINGNFLFLIINNRYFNMVHLYNAAILLFTSYLILKEAKLIVWSKLFSKLYNPIRIGLIISLISGLVFIGKKGLLDNSDHYLWASSIVSFPLTIFIVSIILKKIGMDKLKSKLVVYILSILFLLPTVFSPAISGSLLIILLCFLVNYKTGLSIGVIFFIYFISQYYYDLDFTLLTKSIILFSSGMVFLLFFFITFKKFGANEKV